MVRLALIPRRRQKFTIDERLQRGLERIPGVHRSVEAGLAKLDGAYKSHRAFRGSVRKCKVGMLIAMPNKGAQITARKAVLGDDIGPYVSVGTLLLVRSALDVVCAF
jgi:hypothetical protein